MKCVPVLLAVLLPLVASLSQSDIQRARTLVPGMGYAGRSKADMLSVLNSHLLSYGDRYPNLGVQSCDSFSLSDLHAVQQRLFSAREPTLQPVYTEAMDHRRNAFGQTGKEVEELVDLLTRFKEELEVAALSTISHDIVRDGACHRVVMQYVHHLSEEGRQTQGDLNIPLLPDQQHPAISSSDPSVVPAKKLYDEATACFTCHVTDYGRSAQFDLSNLPPQPVVPDWPAEWTAAFGLYADKPELFNVSSRVWFSGDFPGMHIHHDVCNSHFFTNLPDEAEGHSCEWMFHNDSLHFIWTNAENEQGCCTLVTSDLRANLGLHELGGFVYTGNATVMDFEGNSVVAEQWVSTERLSPPSDFLIYVDGSTGHDVYYDNGGPYHLQWAMAEWEIGTLPKGTFDLPADCSAQCTEKMSVHPLHRTLLKRFGF